MKALPLVPVSAAVALFLAACDQQTTNTTDPAGPEAKEIAVTESKPAVQPAAPGIDVPAELAKQVIGKKLLGNTVKVGGDAFVAADLTKAPEYYLAYYSASW